jgi:hypothetical protein
MAQYQPGRHEEFDRICLKGINGIRNTLVVEEDTESATDAKQQPGAFDRIMRLLDQLRRVGALRYARDANGEFQVVFRVVEPEQENALEELLELTGISKRPSGGRLVLPLRLAVDVSPGDAFVLETRSTLEILRTAGGCIEIPESHLKDGVVEPRVDRHEGRFMRIRTSRVRPGGEGSVAVQYRGWWYYVDDADVDSKRAFVFLRMLVGLRLHEGSQKLAAPVLTIPVG